MTPFASMLLLVGLILGCIVLAKLLSVGAFQITKKPVVRIDEEFAADHWRTPDQRLRGELIQLHAKAGFHQKRAGQMRRPQ